VVSTWLIFRNTSYNSSLLSKNSDSTLSVGVYRNIDENTNDDWKKMLTSLDKQSDVYTDLTKNKSETPEDTTLTAQMAKDVFSNYMLTTKTGETFTSDTADQVVNNVLSLPEYTSTQGAVYIGSNLHVVGNDKSSISSYKTTFNKVLGVRLIEVQNVDDPIEVMTVALQTESESYLSKIDPIIKANKGFISDLLAMNVPSSAVKAHLGVLNASSNILADLEGMRAVLVDPVKSLTVIGQYNAHLNKLMTSLGDVNNYFEEN
jgi:hypothetical protein